MNNVPLVKKQTDIERHTCPKCGNNMGRDYGYLYNEVYECWAGHRIVYWPIDENHDYQIRIQPEIIKV